jgi:hypothetical protein
MLTEVTFALMDLKSALRDVRGLDVRFDPAFINAMTNGRWANTKGARDLALEAVAAAEATGTSQTGLGTLRAAEATTIGGIPRDVRREGARLRDELEDAAWQLKAVPHPGIAVVDATVDTFMAHHCCDVAEMMRESWAQELALVILAVPTYPGAVMTYVPGPLFAEYQ